MTTTDAFYDDLFTEGIVPRPSDDYDWALCLYPSGWRWHSIEDRNDRLCSTADALAHCRLTCILWLSDSERRGPESLAEHRDKQDDLDAWLIAACRTMAERDKPSAAGTSA